MTLRKISDLDTLVITGASRGIGKSVALSLAAQGAKKLILVARNLEALNKVKKEMSASGSESKVYCANVDLLDRKQVDAWVHKMEDFGDFPRHWVFSAGGSPQSQIQRAPFESMMWEDVQKFIDLNLTMQMYLTHKVLPELLRPPMDSSLIYITSQAGVQPLSGHLPYAAAKWGLNGFVRSLFQEHRESGVKTTLIAPGMVDTELIPKIPNIKREEMIADEDVAELVITALRLSTRSCPLEMHVLPQADLRSRFN